MKILYYASMLAGELEEVPSSDENESANSDKGTSRSSTSQIPQVSISVYDKRYIYYIIFFYNTNVIFRIH